MPIAVFHNVREQSSSDTVHVAENLLKENVGKKWKTQTSGEKSAYVILEFAEPQQITGIDIGNEHSAFVEVLVSKTGCSSDDFKKILLSSSFMTPIESKNSSNTNRVRCFSSKVLESATLPEKWKLVKIVCTQPFNKHVQYGLSFIKVHVAAAPVSAARPKSLVPNKFMQALQQPKAHIATLGNIKLRDDSPESESDSQAALFQRWKASRNATPAQTTTSVAAAIRDAAQPSALRRLSNTTQMPVIADRSFSGEPKAAAKVLDRNRESLLFAASDDDDGEQVDVKKRRLSKHIEADRNRRLKEDELQKEKPKRRSIEKRTVLAKVASPKPQQERKEGAQKRLSSPTRDTSKPAKKPRTQEAAMQFRPFDQLLRGVVLVVSGIQNPDRADLRSKAMALGAKYKTDWDNSCTHLICAFTNTPKYNQVKGKGKIITRSWIEKCFALKKYLPWRRYALDATELGQPESDTEILDEALKPITIADKDDDDDVVHCPAIQIDDDNSRDAMDQCSSETDTEDELQRIAEANKQSIVSTTNANGVKKDAAQSIYDLSTDEEDYVARKKECIITNK